MSARISSLEDRLAAVDKTHDDRIRNAERERCAKIVESAFVAALSKNRVGVSLDCLETIAALIRNKE